MDGEDSQYFNIALNGAQSIKIFNHYIVHLKLTTYCKSTTLQ